MKTVKTIKCRKFKNVKNRRKCRFFFIRLRQFRWRMRPHCSASNLPLTVPS